MAADLQVEKLSSALDQVKLSVIVSGSIAATEAVRFIRSLRRLGARVYPVLTSGGAQFVTPLSLHWAATEDVITNFTGDASHLALYDACIVAPASANIIGKITSGITDCPASALVASYLGMGKPVILVPNMHDSLYFSPIFQENLNRLRKLVTVVEPRIEENKRKFPEPHRLADMAAHLICKAKTQMPKAVVTMGTTLGYIDSVRYISNYSSGALGTAISEELYRRGAESTVISGPCRIQPGSCSSLININTNDELENALRLQVKGGCQAIVFAASVLDFVPEIKREGKISSSSELNVSFKRTKKIISEYSNQEMTKIGFKLEAYLSQEKSLALATDYKNKYSLSLVIVNALSDIDEKRHLAYVYEDRLGGDLDFKGILNGKQAIANMVSDHIFEKHRNRKELNG